MKFYHGTTMCFEGLNLSYAKAYKDFGTGIYLATKEDHAKSVALWKRGIEGYVYYYEASLKDVRDLFNVKEFKSASIEFLKYVVSNRTGLVRDTYDVIIGPTADANAQGIIESFIAQCKSPTVGDYNKLRNSLSLQRYPTQICLKTERVVEYFNKHCIGKRRIK